MKHLKIIFLVLVITFVTMGCTKNPPQEPSTQKPETPSAISSDLQNKDTQIKIYLIALNDHGKTGKDIGTGDSLVAVDRTISTPQTPLKTAFNELLTLKDQYYGNTGLYNALYHSNLKVDKATITDKKAEIYLSGSISLGGVMDNPRVENQLNETALQFSTVKEVQIYINGKTLKDALSLK
ncbi:MAG: GerMN domain-containing protein [Bacillota bacterium]|nr:GerMN domain-containing protein [Bacillota bacterium]